MKSLICIFVGSIIYAIGKGIIDTNWGILFLLVSVIIIKLCDIQSIYKDSYNMLEDIVDQKIKDAEKMNEILSSGIQDINKIIKEENENDSQQSS